MKNANVKWTKICMHIIIVAGTRRSDHISPVLRQLRWLPGQQRVVFKGKLTSVGKWL